MPNRKGSEFCNRWILVSKVGDMKQYRIAIWVTDAIRDEPAILIIVDHCKRWLFPFATER